MRLALAALAALLVLAGGAFAAGVKSNPENNKKLGPRDNEGYFLGHPTPTYSWHGCTRTSRGSTGDPLPEGAPPFSRGNKQRAVTFSISDTAPFISWKAKKKYKICGVQATVLLSNPDVPSLLLAEAGYTSGPGKGSTAKSGEESIKVRIADKEINREEFAGYEGKTYSIQKIYDVTVFIKGKKKKRRK